MMQLNMAKSECGWGFDFDYKKKNQYTIYKHRPMQK